MATHKYAKESNLYLGHGFCVSGSDHETLYVETRDELIYTCTQPRSSSFGESQHWTLYAEGPVPDDAQYIGMYDVRKLQGVKVPNGAPKIPDDADPAPKLSGF